MSISSLLEKSLDLIGAELDAPARPSASSRSSWDMMNALSATEDKPTKTAASLLLEQKKQMKERMDATSNINFSFTTTGPTLAPLVQQISTSSVEPPKYWNSSSSTTHVAHKNHGPKHNKAYSASKGGGVKASSVLEQKTKKALATINKGQDYHDRHSGKLAAKQSKQKMKNKLKN